MTEGVAERSVELPERIESGWQTVRRSQFGARAPRYLATVVLFVFFGLGVRACFFPADTTPPPVEPVVTADAPSEDFALQFARAYLTYDAANPEVRAAALAPFLTDQLNADAGFTPASGKQQVLWTQVASDQQALTGGRVITVAAGVTRQPLPVYLAVTVEHKTNGPLVLVGYPSLVGAPAVAADLPVPARTAVTDKAVLDVVGRVLRNYLAGEAPNLKADLTSDAAVTLPTSRLHVLSVNQTLWVAGAGSGAVLVTVNAEGEGGDIYILTYELGIAYRERPYVDFIEVIPTQS